MNAFAAFDERDSGEIDVGELRDAVMHTAPEGGSRVLSAREVDEVVAGFVGRRAFGKGNPTGGGGRFLGIENGLAGLWGWVRRERKMRGKTELVVLLRAIVLVHSFYDMRVSSSFCGQNTVPS